MPRPNAEVLGADTSSSTYLRKILRFTKIEHTAFSLPLVFAGAWIGTRGQTPPPAVLLLVILAAVGARVFGMSFNRIFDRKIDALNPRTAGRELPDGRLTLSTALMVAFSGLLIYLAACAALGGWCLTLSPLPLIPLLGYSLLKRFTALCHFGIGLCLALAPLGAFVAAAGHPNLSPAVVVFALFVFWWLSGSDIIYALMDIESDRQTGVCSLPARLGTTGALWVAGVCHFLAFCCAAAVFYLTDGGPAAALALAVSALAMGAMYLPMIPVSMRFFPVSIIAGAAAAVIPILGRYI
jgi:4-hydroxybenzoate polyprenyltransferase